MAKDKAISIRLNGKKAITSSEDQKEDVEHKEWKNSFREQAATMASSFDPEDLVEYEKNYDETDYEDWRPPKFSKKKAGIPPVLKVFAAAAGAAIIVGVTLGFVMLKMFAGIEEGSQETAGSAITQTTNTAEKGASSGSESGAATGDVNTEALAATVVQTGVFSSNENAAKRTSEIKGTGYAAMVWPQGEQFFVLTGLASSEQTAEALASSLTSSGVEAIVKPWETTSAKASVSEKGAEWIQQFPQLWKDSLTLLEGGKDSEIKAKWKNWVNAFPKDAGEQAKSLLSVAEGVIKGGNLKNQTQINMLSTLYAYQQLGK
ncbi:SPOR domain-containing protein [Radiobacillus deserti]|uniref:SPOR domain-containing protein n=1 Tax=Radiobacillus deserti TaxID=2594883 RepID=A0A516KH64_9BACI|nr:SPOR domain-containing protein [Radiobacillus deserti]QDP40748.1 SPOR domain-containing protein [Radiobacillus deserti]